MSLWHSTDASLHVMTACNKHVFWYLAVLIILIALGLIQTVHSRYAIPIPRTSSKERSLVVRETSDCICNLVTVYSACRSQDTVPLFWPKKYADEASPLPVSSLTKLLLTWRYHQLARLQQQQQQQQHNRDL